MPKHVDNLHDEVITLFEESINVGFDLTRSGCLGIRTRHFGNAGDGWILFVFIHSQ